VEELNEMTRLEVDKLRTLLAEANGHVGDLEHRYMTHATSTQELAQANSAFLQQQRQGMTGSELFTARASAGSALPRSLRTYASDVLHHMKRRQLLKERLQLLLGIQTALQMCGQRAGARNHRAEGLALRSLPIIAIYGSDDTVMVDCYC
jgi:hypothetical protein